MDETSQLILARTSSLSNGGFLDLKSAGTNLNSKPSTNGSGLPIGTSVTVLKFGRSAIILGPGGYASAYDGE